MSKNINRRTLVKGAAWAAPVVVATAAVPAYAASSCVATGQLGSSVYFGWDSDSQQHLDLGGRIDLQGLPADVTIESITFETWIQARTEDNAEGVNVPMWNSNQTNSTGGLGVSDRADQDANSLPWTPNAGTGFLPTATSSTTVPTTHTFSNGTTAAAWEISQYWKATADSDINSRYTNSSVSSCRNFSTGDSGKFVTTWTSVKPATADFTTVMFLSETTWTATLSNGWVLKGSAGNYSNGNAFNTSTTLSK